MRPIPGRPIQKAILSHTMKTAQQAWHIAFLERRLCAFPCPVLPLFGPQQGEWQLGQMPDPEGPCQALLSVILGNLFPGLSFLL